MKFLLSIVDTADLTYLNFRSLKDFPDGSKVSEYNEVLNIGMTGGLSSCLSKFAVCDDESFELVKKAQLEDDGQSK